MIEVIGADEREAGGKVLYAKGSYIFNDEEKESDVRYGMMKIFMPDFMAPKIQSTPQSQLIAQAVAVARQSDVNPSARLTTSFPRSVGQTMCANLVNLRS